MITVIENVTIIPMDKERRVIKRGHVEITGSVISRVIESDLDDYSSKNADLVIDGTGKCLLPGFANAHTHTPMSLLRGYGEGYGLHDWLFKCIFPAEDKLNYDIAYHGALLAITEMMLNGITCFGDQYFFCEAIAQAALKTGIKANISRAIALTCIW